MESPDFAGRKAALLRARDGREALLRRLTAALPRGEDPPWALVWASSAVPGEEKTPLGLIEAFMQAMDVISESLGTLYRGTRGPGPFHTASDSAVFLGLLDHDRFPGREESRLRWRLPGWRDALGIFQTWAVPGDPLAVKRSLLSLEDHLPAGRLIDLDVYRSTGDPVRRTDVGAALRMCLLCREPAWDCIRAQRHAPEEIRSAVDAILEPVRSQCEKREIDLREILEIHVWKRPAERTDTNATSPQ